MMGLTLAERRAVTETTAVRYVLASKRGKSRILDELCANTGWHRNHARKALKSALAPKVVTPRSPRPVKYGDDVIAALTVCWTVLGMPAGKRLAPMLGELVAVLRHFGELTIDEGQEVIVLEEESGWAWVRTTLGEEGWIPLENMQDLSEKPDSIPDLTG